MNPHVHVSAATAVTVFLMVGVVGALWRFAAMRLAASDNPTAQQIAGALAWFY